MIILIDLAIKIGLCDDLIEKLKTLDGKKAEKLADICLQKGFNILEKHNHITRLAVILTLAVRVKDEYEKAGISEEIYYDTMSDIKIWCMSNGNKGLKNYRWLKNHVSFELFRIGRLQFQLYESNNKTLLYSKLPFSYGDKLIYIHIPEGEKLEKSKCLESLEKADEFFRTYFTDYCYKYYFCESWLLFEGNRNFMAKDSNIVAFMSLFKLCYSVGIDVQAIERIYGKREIFKSRYAEATDLQKRAKQYMLQGKKLGIGIGVIEH